MNGQGSPRLYHTAKRLMDILGASVGLVALGLLFPPIGLAIWLEDRGPILFVQERVGKDGQLFHVYKFRTMRGRAPANGTSLGDEEGRVTVVGRFLRRTALDEVPQFINVLKGEMSLVGPRPELPERYTAYSSWQRRRVEILPGMTGWWQVRGRRQPMIDHIEDDIYYLEHRSLGLDLRILLMTIPALLGAGTRSRACGLASDRTAGQGTPHRTAPTELGDS